MPINKFKSAEFTAGTDRCPVCGLPIDSGNHDKCKIETDQAVVDKETLSEEEIAAQARELKKQKDKISFEFGMLPPENNVQQYVEQLANKLPKKEGFPLQVHVAPYWKGSNATVFDDGTTFISPQLIVDAETEEALLGVLGHEYIHSSRRHFEDIKTVEEPTPWREGLAQVGRMRKHEYEADLRSNLELLDEAGINPAGYKSLLERQHQKQTWGGTIHGSSLDRALNITTAFYVYDLKSTEEDLHPISPNILLEMKQGEMTWMVNPITRRPKNRFNADKELKTFQEERRNAIEELKPEEIIHAILSVDIHVRQTKESADKDVDDQKALDRLIERFEEEYLTGLEKDDDKEVVRILALEYFTSLTMVETEEEKKITGFSTPEEIEEARKAFEKFSLNSNLPYSDTDVNSFFSKIIAYCENNEIFGDFETNDSDKGTYLEFIEQWSKTLEKLSARFDSTIVTSDDIKESELKQEIEKPEEIDQRVRGVIEKLVSVKTIQNYLKAVEEVKGELKEELEGKTLKETCENIKIIYESIYSSVKAPSIENFFGSGRSDMVYRYTVIELFQYCINNLAQFSDLPDNEKKAIVYSVTQRAGIEGAKKDINDLTRYYKELAIEYKEKASTSDSREEEQDYQYGYRAYEYDTETPDLYRDDDIINDEMAGPNVNIDERDLKNSPEQVAIRKRALKKMKTKLDSISSADFLFEDFTDENVEIWFKYLADSKFHDGNKTNITIEITSIEHGQHESYAAKALNKLLTKLSLAEAFNKIEELESKNLPVREFMKKNPREYGYLVLNVVEAAKKGNLEDFKLQDLLFAGKLITNPFLQGAFQRYVTQERWQDLSFEEKLELLYPADGNQEIFDYQLRDYFIENEVTNKEQYDAVKDRINKSAEDFLGQHDTEAGTFAILDRVSFRFRDVNSFMRALLNSGRDEKELKTMVYDMLRPNTLHEYTEEEFKKIIQQSSDAVRSIYTLDGMGKYVLLRKLLTSEGGALPEPHKRKEFFNMIFNEWMQDDPSQKDITSVLKKVNEVISDMPDWQLLYFGIHSTLQDKIACPPTDERSVPWLDIYELEDDIKRSHTSINPTSLVNTVVWRSVPAKAKENPQDYSEQYLSFAEEQLRRFLSKKGVLTAPESEPMKPLSFTKEVASKSGAMGVRFLQLLPQFVELSDLHSKEFSEVYDRVHGQSKLAALALLEREWPQIWEEMEQIGQRIGGGSIVTVFEATTNNGEEEVIKVRNPNIKYHLDSTHEFVEQVLEKLASKYGGVYESIKTILDDLREWIENDINFQGFLEQDKEFKEKYDGMKLENGRYQVIVPQSKGPTNPYFSREQKIIGTNLTQWEELEKKGHNMKEVVGLLSQLYLKQILDGQVHSDVHPGNFSVTEDDKVLIYDRNFYLNLNDKEKDTIIGLFNPSIDSREKVENVLSYIEISQGASKEKVEGHINNFVEAVNSQQWNQAYQSLTSLRRDGAKTPLNFTLLLKNMNSLQLLSKRAGFKELSEAFTYQP